MSQIEYVIVKPGNGRFSGKRFPVMEVLQTAMKKKTFIINVADEGQEPIKHILLEESVMFPDELEVKPNNEEKNITAQQDNEYMEQLVEAGLQIANEDIEAGKDYFKHVFALLVNTTSFAWNSGNIERFTAIQKTQKEKTGFEFLRFMELQTHIQLEESNKIKKIFEDNIKFCNEELATYNMP